MAEQDDGCGEISLEESEEESGGKRGRKKNKHTHTMVGYRDIPNKLLLFAKYGT